MSLIKFIDEKHSSGQDLHWNRAELDGAPFVGSPSPMTEAEYEKRVKKFHEVQVKRFDCLQADQRQEYEAILDMIRNNRAELIGRHTIHEKDCWFVAIEYSLPFMMDTKTKGNNS